jgi:hypothetical protein
MHAKKFWGWFILAWLITAFPLMLLHAVPGVDTPNHVARLHVLASLPNSSTLGQYYKSHWVLLPNLAVDLFVTPLVYLFNLSALTLMKVFLINMVGITGAAFAILNRAISGKWSPWGLAGLLFTYSYVLGFGFTNYLFGIALALLTVGIQLLLKDKPYLRGFVLAVGFPILLLNHLLALVFAAITIGSLAFWQKDKSKGLWTGFGIGCFFCLIYMKLSAAAPVTEGFRYDPFGHHLRNIFFPLYFSNLLRDLSFWLVIVGIVSWLLFKQKRKPALAGVALALFLFLALILPHMAMTSAYLSGRVSLWAILVGGALIEEIAIAPSLIFTLLFVRSGDVSLRFLDWNKTFDQLHADLKVIQNDSLVYQMVTIQSRPLQPEGWNPSLLHADCLLLLEKDCYVNNLFSLPFQQPLRNADDIGFDLRDLYNLGSDRSVQINNRIKLVGQLKAMTPELKKKPVYIFFIKSESQVPVKNLGKVLVERPRYVIYQFR